MCIRDSAKTPEIETEIRIEPVNIDMSFCIVVLLSIHAVDIPVFKILKVK